MTFKIVEAILCLWIGAMGGIIIISLFDTARNKYFGSVLVETKAEGIVMYTLEIDGDLDELQHKRDILLKVTPTTAEVRD